MDGNLEMLTRKTLELEMLIPTLSDNGQIAIRFVVDRIYEALERKDDETAYSLLEQVALHADF